MINIKEDVDRMVSDIHGTEEQYDVKFPNALLSLRVLGNRNSKYNGFTIGGKLTRRISRGGNIFIFSNLSGLAIQFVLHACTRIFTKLGFQLNSVYLIERTVEPRANRIITL